SERMHACIFCLLQGTRVVDIDINSSPQQPETKHTDLMSRFGLREYCVPATCTPDVLCSAVESALTTTWDWEGIGQRIEEFSEAQTEFLSVNLPGFGRQLTEAAQTAIGQVE